MKFISHRGNLIGPYPDLENRPDYITNALTSGFECECDVWWHNDAFWLGHDKPQYIITDPNFLNQDKLWIHAKNALALHMLKKYHPKTNFFWHQEDEYTITNQGYIWAYPGALLTDQIICVMPENSEVLYSKSEKAEALGVCSDYIVLEKLEEIRRNT